MKTLAPEYSAGPAPVILAAPGIQSPYLGPPRLCQLGNASYNRRTRETEQIKALALRYPTAPIPPSFSPQRESRAPPVRQQACVNWETRPTIGGLAETEQIKAWVLRYPTAPLPPSFSPQRESRTPPVRQQAYGNRETPGGASRSPAFALAAWPCLGPGNAEFF